MSLVQWSFVDPGKLESVLRKGREGQVDARRRPWIWVALAGFALLLGIAVMLRVSPPGPNVAGPAPGIVDTPLPGFDDDEEHPDYPTCTWMGEAKVGMHRLGYWQWVRYKCGLEDDA